MPIIKKPDYTIFASEAKKGELSDFPNLLRGWGVTIDQTAGKPPMEWFNILQKRTDEWLTYLSQRGISEWDNTLDYPKTAVVQFGGTFYVSIKENREQKPDKSQNYWQEMVTFLGISKSIEDLRKEVEKKLTKDQNGADIPDKALFRQNIDLVKQTSGTDANAGRVLVLPANSTGAFGVGGAANNPVSQHGGFFAYSPESSALSDIGLNMNGVGYQSAYDTNRRGQIFQSFNDGALRYRITTSNTAADNTTPWRVAFDNINLVPTRDDQTTLSLTSAAAIHAWALANTSRSFRNDGINTDDSTIRFGSGAFTKVNGTYSILTASSSASTPGLKIQAGDANGYVSYNVWTDKNLPNLMSASEIVGIPLPFPGEVPPSGWLKCNGQAFNKTTYPVLASLYPTGKLPDLRGEFIRGWDDGRKVDTGRNLLSAQGDAIRNITGKFANNGLAWAEGASSSVGEGAFTRLKGGFPSNNNLGSVGCQYELDISKVVPTANENRPRNIAFNYIVRAA